MKIILFLSVGILCIITFPNTAEAAQVAEVDDYYYRTYYVDDAQYGSITGRTTKLLRFTNGYTKGSTTQRQVSSTLFTRTYKYTYSYYTY